MKKFMILHYGFETPTPEIMEPWNQWFNSITDRQIQRGHFPTGLDIDHKGTTKLPLTKDSITGYTMIHAENLEEAEKIARECPIIASTRVYEVMEG